MLENLTDVRALMDEVHECSSTLLSDQCAYEDGDELTLQMATMMRRGCYWQLTRVLVQYLLERGNAEDRTKLIAKVRGNVVGLARHKVRASAY